MSSKIQPMAAVVLALLLVVIVACGGGSSSPTAPGPTPTPTPAPLWSMAGSGNTVFDMPTRVTRVRITGNYPGRSTNFIVWVGTRLVVNELLGTSWPAGCCYEGTHLVTGGVTRIEDSNGVAWMFTEIRQ